MFVRADEVEAEVIAQTKAALDDPALAERMQKQDRPNAEAITQQLARDEAALTQLGIDLDDETITRSEWSDRRARLQDRISAARAELADVEGYPVLKRFLGGAEAFDRAWGEASDDMRRGVVLSVLNGVKVLPAVRGRNRFDPDRLVPDWRS